MDRLKEINIYSKFSKWREPAGTFRCFFRATNFVTLKHFPDFELVKYSNSKYEKELLKIIDEYNGKSVIFIIELPGVDAIYCSWLLNMVRHINPILTFNCILHPNGIIGSKEYISTLLINADDIKRHEDGNWAFILDSERYDESREIDNKMYFNNEYEISDTDLPSYEMLQEQGLDTLVYLYTGDIKEDIRGFLDYYIENGFNVIEKGINN